MPNTSPGLIPSACPKNWPMKPFGILVMYREQKTINFLMIWFSVCVFLFHDPQSVYTVKKEYEKEMDGQRKKIAELGPRKFEGIGPTTKEGIPIVLRSVSNSAFIHLTKCLILRIFFLLKIWSFFTLWVVVVSLCLFYKITLFFMPNRMELRFVCIYFWYIFSYLFTVLKYFVVVYFRK